MAPDRGVSSESSADGRISGTSMALGEDEDATHEPQPNERQEEFASLIAKRSSSDTNFTIRGTLLGLVIGIIICFSNTYFGLQTGWISGMTMPAALIGFAFFKSIARCLDRPFTPVENVLVQTVAGAVGTMPVAAGLVGVIPALEILLEPSENGPMRLDTWRLTVWSLGVCFFGVFVAVPLRKEVIIREKLPFPSGTATALMIGVLHGGKDDKDEGRGENPLQVIRMRSGHHAEGGPLSARSLPEEAQIDHRRDWKAKIRLLLIAFAISAIYTLTSYFIPYLHHIPFLGYHLAHEWLWTLNPSPAYCGQGIIMGPATTMHMLLGAILGWGVLSPLAKSRGWAAGPVGDWETGSKGWIVWISLAIMLADSVVNLGWLALRPLTCYGPRWAKQIRDAVSRRDIGELYPWRGAYSQLSGTDTTAPLQPLNSSESEPVQEGQAPPTDVKDLPEPDAPPEHLVNNRVIYLGFLASVVVCIVAVQVAIPNTIPVWATIVAILFSLVLALMGVRAEGETDLNPVSGISKLTQLAFALVIPASAPNAIAINLLAGAISEAAALQAGDMAQDLKAGHLMGASPKAQFYGQLIGSVVGAFTSAIVYRLYTNIYKIPGDLFQIPTAFVWIFTSRLVNGKGLPEMAWQWAVAAGCVWVVLTVLRVIGMRGGEALWWHKLVPGGIAVAVGMYNTPSFTLARAVGGLASAYWKWRGGETETVIVLASGLILGEGVLSIVNLVLASLQVPHL